MGKPTDFLDRLAENIPLSPGHALTQIRHIVLTVFRFLGRFTGSILQPVQKIAPGAGGIVMQILTKVLAPVRFFYQILFIVLEYALTFSAPFYLLCL